MKRRAALKRLGLTSAAIVATPTLLSLLNSCTTEQHLWKPQFLSHEGGIALQKMADVFLPKTELPSASALNIPEFLDKYLNDVFLKEEQVLFKAAYDNTLDKLKTQSQKEVDDLEEKDIENFLDEHLKVNGEIDIERQNNISYQGLTTSECLNAIKYMCIDAYITNKNIGENVLAYDPVPGIYYCDDLDKLTKGKRWSLGNDTVKRKPI
ncbi:gluconate 2-dehydrogenase subunit 3 family protein [Mesohalobacter halotolerans]|jgi:hypothetical protein|uniref:Gluconate 2-dehydrogenase subunit 3 family protein n=1 Tax=Mesohalobacter halotolerans TaxID=1883405 RepID=A0A4U5TTG4_9FLAO|nr:gluconate 2-dehydrogenase subunit 3 family protein [Mesohalobacter halotolerans]MBS3738874.1 gluconate 2-dehydrogenase subunit 3 family protein [Psychroflexus sp.]NBC58253.1 gluconate 2-dehydrogenase subunit 3 family protein [Bacteroidota bacterium]TKS57151.1 gluconate 2-dehydrogenase subunit 3 family protein [Mesohalobacter halotolerans]